MKKVFQTRISKNNGNCAQAVVASLFDLELDDVPDFVSKHSIRPMNVEIVKFHNERGFKAGYINKHNNLGIRNKSLLEIAKSDGGVNGYFYAIVKSKTFEDTLHAVVVDTELNIVHDPNPNGNCLNLKPDDIIKILTTSINLNYK